MRLIVLITCVCFSISVCGQKTNQGETVIVDQGVEIPISACVEANSKILGNLVSPVAFCKCFIPKFYRDLINDPEKLRLIKGGNWFEISKEKQDVVAKYFQECIAQTATNDTTAKVTITPRMALGIKKKMKQELEGSEIEKTADLDKYCDCIVNSMQTDFTAKELMQTNFNETEKYRNVVEKCLLVSRKNK